MGSKIAQSLLTRTWVDAHSPSITPLTRGAQAAMKQEKAEFVSANHATESGRKTTSLTTCTDVQFHFTP